MDFFGMGMGEILLILLVALIIWGPGRITDVGRTMGKLARTLKKATSDFTTQITRETEEQKKKPPPQEKQDEASGEQGTRVSEQ
jgi:sec-independent protein translocase protein TatA